MTHTDSAQVLVDAAQLAQHAPSILNTQPWRWRVRSDCLELLADRARQVHSVDPDGRLLILSCGAALHHARVVLAAIGQDVSVKRFPDPADADLLARVRLLDGREPGRGDIEAVETIRRRHTDRRPFAATVPVPVNAMTSMKRAATTEDAQLYQIAANQLPSLAAACDKAADTHDRDERYQADLDTWTHRPHNAGDGVRAETVTAQTPRRVPVRDFAPGRETLLDPGFGDDRFAEYLIVATSEDTPYQWLRAGEATSSVWLTATAAGLVASVMSDVIEVPRAREILDRLLDPPGHAQLVLRVGVNMQPPLPAGSPRRTPSEVIEREPSGQGCDDHR